MKSYYGNLIVDTFDLLFSTVSLLLIWMSFDKDSYILFGITAVIYMLPRFLIILLGITNNTNDIYRLKIDIISMVALAVSFGLVCVILINQYTSILSTPINIYYAQNIFFIFSAISLGDIAYKLFIGLVQKYQTIKNNSNFVKGGN